MLDDTIIHNIEQTYDFSIEEEMLRRALRQSLKLLHHLNEDFTCRPESNNCTKFQDTSWLEFYIIMLYNPCSFQGNNVVVNVMSSKNNILTLYA